MNKMTTIEKMLHDHFNDFPTERIRYATLMSLMFIFRGINAYKLTKVFSGLGYEYKVSQAYKESLLDNGYILKNIKTYLFLGAKCKHKTILSLRKECEVKPEDYGLINFAKKGRLNDVLVDYHDKFSKIGLYGINVAIDNLCNLKSYCKKYVIKKMTFLVSTHSFDYDDLVQELLYKGIQGVLRMYPCIKSDLHATNIAKHAIHNHGINIIKYYTSSSRQTLERNTDNTFEAKLVSYDILPDNIINQPDNNQNRQYQLIDDTMSVRTIMRKTTGKKLYFLKLLMGEYDAKFSSYLNNNGITVDNETYMEKCIRVGHVDRYVNKSLSFLCVDRKKGTQYINKLRCHLGAQNTITQ